MSAVCPSCGVAVVPGYVKCPKCHAALPYGSGRRAHVTADPGGTTLQERGFPWLPIVGALAVVVGVIVVFGLLDGDDGARDEPPVATPARPVGNSPAATPAAPVAPTTTPPPAAAPARNPSATAAELDRTLRKQKLWSTVEVTGQRIDVRSAACGDAAMTATLEGAVPALHEAGLTRLRCLAQSGAVVFERDL